MGPSSLNDSILPTSNPTISIPLLKDNGSNWVNYKTKALIAMGSQGLIGHIEGCAQKPKQYTVISSKAVLADGKTEATKEQIKTCKKHIEDYETKTYLAHHIMINSVSTQVAQYIGTITTPKDMWDYITKEYEDKTLLFQSNTCQQLQSMKCSEGENIRTHLTEMDKIHQELAGMGAPINDKDYTPIII
jgi:hypothetical protein